jgi:hypothetical protein
VGKTRIRDGVASAEIADEPPGADHRPRPYTGALALVGEHAARSPDERAPTNT